MDDALSGYTTIGTIGEDSIVINGSDWDSVPWGGNTLDDTFFDANSSLSGITMKTESGHEIKLTPNILEKLITLIEVIENLDEDHELRIQLLTTLAMKKLGAE
jgi:hypothetical protein